MKRRFHPAIIPLIILSFLSIKATAQDNTLHLLDSFYTAQSNDKKLMGNVLVAFHDSIIYEKSFGYQDIEKNIRNTDSSAFAMASVTKIFTATAILQLKEKGLLHLDDVFVNYFTDFPYPDITIRQLLSHTSGLPAYELFIQLAKARPEKIFTNEDVIPALRKWNKPLHNDPGDGWYYSSMNYCLLAMLVEKLSGLTLPEYFGKYIFEPAGMQHSYLENYLTVKKNPNRTINYAPRNPNSSELVNVNLLPGEKTMVYNCGGFMGQGGLITTTADMVRFDDAYFSGRLISRSSMAEAMTPTKLKDGRPAVTGTLLGKGFAGYGLGWVTGVHPILGKIVWHTGGRPGITTIYVHDLSKDQTIFIFENTRGNGRLESMAASALDIINSLPFASQ